MSRAELKKVLVMEKLAHQVKVVEAIVLLGLSPPVDLANKATYLEKGIQGLAYQNQGRKPSHAIPDSLKQQFADCVSVQALR